MIEDGRVVSLRYELTNDAGALLDASALTYLHGKDAIVPGLERALAGRRAGEKLSVIVAPREGYGEREPDSQVRAPRELFPADVPLEPGTVVVLDGEDGADLPVWIVELTEDAVVLDKNHPLAGVTLRFAVEITNVRDATAEEKKHGHAHPEAD